MRKNEFRTLFHFFAALLLIVLAELLLRPVQQRLLLPMLWNAYGVPSPASWDLRSMQLFLLEGSGILMMLFALLSWITAGPVSNLFQSLGQQLEQYLSAVIPGLNSEIWSSASNQTSILSIFGISLLLLLLQVLPYILAGWYFTRYVVRESARVQKDDAERQKQLDLERNRMLSNIAHDIRNPITTISGYAQALDDGMVTDPVKQQEYLRSIRKKTDRVEELISLLFDYAKLNSGGVTLHAEPTDLCELLRQNAALSYTDAEEAQMELIPEIPNQPVIRSVDRLQFSRVITNLVNNAIRYNAKGTRILIRCEVDPEGWEDDRIIVADNGTAIDDATADTLFEPFSRGDTARPTDGGSGLGLSIVKSIVELHGGSITYKDSFEDYTKAFIIRLPNRETENKHDLHR